MPIITSAIYNLFWTYIYRQVFYTDIEVALFTLVILGLVIGDICQSERTLEHLRPEKDDGEHKSARRYKMDQSHNTTNMMDLTPRDILLASVGKTDGHNLSQAVIERLLARYVNGKDFHGRKGRSLESVKMRLQKGRLGFSEPTTPRRRGDRLRKNNTRDIRSWPSSPRDRDIPVGEEGQALGRKFMSIQENVPKANFGIYNRMESCEEEYNTSDQEAGSKFSRGESRQTHIGYASSYNVKQNQVMPMRATGYGGFNTGANAGFAGVGAGVAVAHGLRDDEKDELKRSVQSMKREAHELNMHKRKLEEENHRLSEQISSMKSMSPSPDRGGRQSYLAGQGQTSGAMPAPNALGAPGGDIRQMGSSDVR